MTWLMPIYNLYYNNNNNTSNFFVEANSSNVLRATLALIACHVDVEKLPT